MLNNVIVKPRKVKLKKRICFAIPYALIIIAALLGCGDKSQQKANHLERAHQFIAEKKYNEAVLELKNVVQIDPNDDMAHYDLGETYITLNQRGLAAQAFENAVSANPENLQAQMKMGQIFLTRGDILEARKIVKMLMEKTPDDIEVLNLLAGIQIQEKNTHAAIMTLQKAVSINDGNKETQLLLGGLMLDQGNAEEAEKAFQRVLSIDPSEPVAYLELIRLTADRNQWEKVPPLLNRLIEISKRRYDYLAKLGIFFEHHQKWKMAESVYLKAVASAETRDPAPLMNLGTYYARRQLNDKALEKLHSALGKKPDDPTILSFIAKTHFDLTHFENAKEYADMALQKDPQHEQANYIRGRVYFLDGNYAAAIERLDQAIKAAPNNALAYYFKALSLIAGKDAGLTSESDLLKAAAGFFGDNEAWEAELAINNLKRVLELEPGMLHAKLLLAELYLRRREENPAREQIESALSQAPNNEKAIILLTGLKVLKRDWQGAIDLCEKAIAKNKNHSDWLIRLGTIYSMTNRPADALQAFKKAHETVPGNIQPIQLMVNIYIRQKRFEEALTLCETHSKNRSNDPARLAELETIKGTIYLARGDKPAAVHSLQKAIAGNSNILTPHFTLARLYLEENKTDQAMAHYETVLRLDEKNVAAVMAMGNIHYLRKENQKAEDYYRRALSIKPNHGPAANNLAFILSGNEMKLDEAYRFAQLAVRKMPQDASARDTMGWIFHLQGNYVEAIEEFEQSLAINPQNAIVHYHLGLSYYKRGEFKTSRVHIKKALSLDPNFIGADEAKILFDG